MTFKGNKDQQKSNPHKTTKSSKAAMGLCTSRAGHTHAYVCTNPPAHTTTTKQKKLDQRNQLMPSGTRKSLRSRQAAAGEESRLRAVANWSNECQPSTQSLHECSLWLSQSRTPSNMLYEEFQTRTNCCDLPNSCFPTPSMKSYWPNYHLFLPPWSQEKAFAKAIHLQILLAFSSSPPPPSTRKHSKGLETAWNWQGIGKWLTGCCPFHF